MTQEEKNILIKELCMRIPYGVKCNINGKLCKVTRVDVECQQVYLKKDDGHGGTYSIARGDIIKPYLRPMSSMTEEEKSWYESLRNALTYQENGEYDLDDFNELNDFLNRRKLDRYGLIEKGLALEAPEGMYK